MNLPHDKERTFNGDSGCRSRGQCCTCVRRRSARTPQKANGVAVWSGAVTSQVCSYIDMPCMNQIKAHGARLHSDKDSWSKMRIRLESRRVDAAK